MHLPGRASWRPLIQVGSSQWPFPPSVMYGEASQSWRQSVEPPLTLLSPTSSVARSRRYFLVILKKSVLVTVVEICDAWQGYGYQDRESSIGSVCRKKRNKLCTPRYIPEASWEPFVLHCHTRDGRQPFPLPETME